MYDTIFRNGRVVDGTGNVWYKGDVAIRKENICEIGKVDEGASEEIDASNLIVAPGFIDTHSHSDLVLISNPEAKQKIMQGITTEIIGQDGLGEAPICDDVVNLWRKYLAGLNGDPDIDWTWRSFRDYLDELDKARPATNVAALVGHGNLRLLAMGMENRTPSDSELSYMKELLLESLKDGAFGLSTGLIYAPCVYAETEELIELCKPVQRNDGVFVVHIRNEGDYLIESIKEIMQVGIKSGARVHISHFKSSGELNWGKSIEALRLLEEFRENDVDVSFDQYPYTAGSTFLSSLLPDWAHEGGVEVMMKRLLTQVTRMKILQELSSLERTPQWDKLLITSVKSLKNKKLEGMSVKRISEKLDKEPASAILDLILEEDNGVTMALFTQSEEDVKRIMSHPLQTVCTDGIVLGKPHPRAYGSFPRILGKYVKEGVINVEEAIRKMTSWPASRFRLTKRGILRPGFKADITVFDPDRIKDTATYDSPIRYPEGVEYVMVNGKLSVMEGELTGIRYGKVLHRT